MDRTARGVVRRGASTLVRTIGGGDQGPCGCSTGYGRGRGEGERVAFGAGGRQRTQRRKRRFSNGRRRAQIPPAPGSSRYLSAAFRAAPVDPRRTAAPAPSAVAALERSRRDAQPPGRIPTEPKAWDGRKPPRRRDRRDRRDRRALGEALRIAANALRSVADAGAGARQRRDPDRLLAVHV
jgi:hypothetical protein